MTILEVDAARSSPDPPAEPVDPAGPTPGSMAELELPGHCEPAEVAHKLVHLLRDLGTPLPVRLRAADGRRSRMVAVDEALNLTPDGLASRLSEWVSAAEPEGPERGQPGGGGLHLQDLTGTGIRRAVPRCHDADVIAVLGDVEQVLRPIDLDGQRAIATMETRQVLLVSRSQRYDALVLARGLAEGNVEREAQEDVR